MSEVVAPTTSFASGSPPSRPERNPGETERSFDHLPPAFADRAAACLRGMEPQALRPRPTMPDTWEHELELTCAILSRAARQRLLKMSPRERVIALLTTGISGWSQEKLMHPADFIAVLHSFAGPDMVGPEMLVGLQSCFVERLYPERHAEMDAWLASYPDLDRVLHERAVVTYACKHGIAAFSTAAEALAKLDGEERTSQREAAAVHMASEQVARLARRTPRAALTCDACAATGAS